MSFNSRNEEYKVLHRRFPTKEERASVIVATQYTLAAKTDSEWLNFTISNAYMLCLRELGVVSSPMN